MKIANEIIESLQHHPEEWKLDRYELTHTSGVSLWIANMGISYILVGMMHPRVYRPKEFTFGLRDTIRLHFACRRIIKQIMTNSESRSLSEIKKMWSGGDK